MKKVKAFLVICLVLGFLFVGKVDSAFSQQPYQGDLYINIKHVFSIWDDLEIYNQYFLANILTFEEESNFPKIEELIITTPVGDIKFPFNNISIDPNKPLVLGSLKSPMNIEKFIIIKAVAKIGGIFYDITDTVYPSEQFLFEIVKLSDENSSCPPKLLDFSIGQGIFAGFECGDYCHTIIEVDGELEDFYHRPNLAYFFENEANIGKKIKFMIEIKQVLMYEGESTDSSLCAQKGVINNVIVLPK
ncbi:MAG: hypothetical protein LBE80_03580 [Deltaproteobacteria bacterium]|jgi:hypothetical protein|nr:hypothetical protein [Deltaproteobacteria bacterium]